MSRQINIIRSSDVELRLTILDSTGTIVDLTNQTVTIMVKASLSDSNAQALITKSQTSHTNPTAGQTTISLTNAETNVTLGKYFYDIKLVSQTGSISSVELGKFRILDSVNN